MKIKKAPVFGETKGLNKTNKQNDFKSNYCLRQCLAERRTQYDS